MSLDKGDHERLVAIREEMMDLLEEAKNIVRLSDNRRDYERATAYWIGHIDTALGGGNYVDTYDYTMLKTINELEPAEDDEEEWDNEEDEVPASVQKTNETNS